MKVRYKIGSEDVAELNLQHLNEMPTQKRIQWRESLGVSSVFVVAAIGLFLYQSRNWLLALVLMFFGILWFLFYSRVLGRGPKKVLKMVEKKEYGVTELDIDKEGIGINSEDMFGVISWVHIQKVVQTDRHIFMYQTSGDGIIIPRSNLECEVDWDELGAYIRSCSWCG